MLVTCCSNTARAQGVEWSSEEDHMLVEQLRSMRGGLLTNKNMTVRVPVWGGWERL